MVSGMQIHAHACAISCNVNVAGMDMTAVNMLTMLAAIESQFRDHAAVVPCARIVSSLWLTAANHRH